MKLVLENYRARVSIGQAAAISVFMKTNMGRFALKDGLFGRPGHLIPITGRGK